MSEDNRTLLQALIGDGRPLLLFSGVALLLSGGFGFFQAATGHFLPHDEAYLGLSAQSLCEHYDCRIVRFMVHDRIAFAGALIAVGALYMWIAEFPLRRKESWAWWALCLSGSTGFLSFLTFLGYGYLDTWHGVATLLLLPCFGGGLLQSYFTVQPDSLAVALRSPGRFSLTRTAEKLGIGCLLLTAIGLTASGLIIAVGGMSRVFVPEDLQFMLLYTDDLNRISERLIPLIAHDRASFGGSLVSTGIVMGFCVYCGRPSPSLWQVLLIAGTAGFGSAIGVHYQVGYVNLRHLFPAYVGSGLFLAGMMLTYRMMSGQSRSDKLVRGQSVVLDS